MTRFFNSIKKAPSKITIEDIEDYLMAYKKKS